MKRPDFESHRHADIDGVFRRHAESLYESTLQRTRRAMHQKPETARVHLDATERRATDRRATDRRETERRQTRAAYHGIERRQMQRRAHERRRSAEPAA